MHKCSGGMPFCAAPQYAHAGSETECQREGMCGSVVGGNSIPPF
jgi:hypothetical protein